MKGFRAFPLRGNVVDLAVGIVIGAAFTTVVNKLVADFVSPFIALFGGESDFSRFYFSISGKKFLYGDFINGLIAFLISATVLYLLVVRPYGYLMDHFHHGPPPDRKKQCPTVCRDPAGRPQVRLLHLRSAGVKTL